MQSRTRAEISAKAEAGVVEQRTPIAVGDLTARAHAARLAGDITELERLIPQLAEAMDKAAVAPKRREAHLALADALATRALEGALRSALLPDQRAATSQEIATAIAELEALPEVDAEPARLRATTARIALARGDAIEDVHAVVLLPTYRDTELRLLALAEPLWRPGRGEAMSAAAVSELVQELRDEPRRTGLLKLLLAVALHSQGKADDALVVLDELLAEVPNQPTATALRQQWTRGVVAVADPIGEPDLRGDGAEGTDDGGEPVAEPEPDKPKPDKPKPDKPKPDKPKPPRGFDALLAEGCKLAKGGDAQKGLDLLQKAYDIKPGGNKITLCMAEAHRSLGRNASARAMCDRVLRKSPGNKQANLLMAKLQHERGDTAAAVRHYKKVLDKDPDNATAKAYVDNNG